MTGIVSSVAGSSAPSVRVAIYSDAAFSALVGTLTTDSLGVYATDLAPGTFYVKASADTNVNATYFEAGLDEIGTNGAFTVNAGLTTVGDVALEAVATAGISGQISGPLSTWAAAVTRVVSFDTAQGWVRYQAGPLNAGGQYSLNEVTGATVGVVAYKDLNGNDRFDMNAEPATTVTAGVTAPITGVDGSVPEKRLITGTISNGEVWKVYAEDRSDPRDPAGNRWIVGTQLLGAGGAFSIVAFPATYRLNAFYDTNGNGIADLNEPDVRLRVNSINPDVNTVAGDAGPYTLVIPPDIQILRVAVSGDTSGDGVLQPGETGFLDVTIQNLGAPTSDLAFVASAQQNVVVTSQPGAAPALAMYATTILRIGVTAATAASGSQLRVDLDLTAAGNYSRTRKVFAGIFSGTARYVAVAAGLAYATIAADPDTIQLGGAMGAESSELVDFRAGQGYVTNTDFAFPFYGMWQTDASASAFNQNLRLGVEVGDNGYLDFIRSADVVPPLALPSADSDAQMTISALWTDLAPGNMWLLVAGTAPNRVMTIEWQDAARASNPLQIYNFQVRLHELSGAIDVIYKTVDVRSGDSFGINYGDGTLATIWPAPSDNASFTLTPQGM